MTYNNILEKYYDKNIKKNQIICNKYIKYKIK